MRLKVGNEKLGLRKFASPTAQAERTGEAASSAKGKYFE
jgi:hypothetical protein